MVVYKVYNDKTDIHIADIYYKDNVYKARLLNKDGVIPTVFGFPILGSVEEPESECLEAFLSSRVIPWNRDNLQHILEVNGVYEYDWKHLIKLNKGRTVEDCFRIEVVELDE